ncbi:RELT-like protein 2 isoform X1 [Esox lucius]|uniref:RELT like 2 n=1 Tax=Esox lucius TaxID=8010 RepID=A0A3P9A3L4_ESOLU|nr:RELT-like protein 2 isoform X1 [Esox lucius]XP_012988974.2 RELT-like protein 2 isoform X1 [Esox lucius]
MTDLEALTVGEPPPPYIIFLLVFFFFITGLLGFLVCHLLKKRGYRCRTGDEEGDDEECEEKLGPDKNAGGHAASSDSLLYITDDEEEKEDNQDTVEQILKCIIENEANMEAFKEMLGKQNICEHRDPRLLRKESLGGIPPHHHTIHSGAQLDHKSCTLCVQGRSKKARRQSRVARPNKPKTPGERRESTVFAVGRFRVTHMEKKDQGSGDQLDQSETLDSEKGNEDHPQKTEEYNLQSMFKDVKTETTANVVPPAKRKKSLVLFSLRRGSDQAAAKGSLSKPVVEEEPLFNAPLKAAMQTSSSAKALSSHPSKDPAGADHTETALKTSPTTVTFVVSPSEDPAPVSPNRSPGGVSPLTPPVQDSPITTPIQDSPITPPAWDSPITTPGQVTPMTPEIFPLTPGSPTNPNPCPFNVSPAPVQASPALSSKKMPPSLSSTSFSPASTQIHVCPTPVQAPSKTSHLNVSSSFTPLHPSSAPTSGQVSPAPSSRKLSLTPTPTQVSPALSSRNVPPALSSRNVSPAPTSFPLSPVAPRSILKNTTTYPNVEKTTASISTAKGPGDKVPSMDPMKYSACTSPEGKACPDSQEEGTVMRVAEVVKGEEPAVVRVAEVVKGEEPAMMRVVEVVKGEEPVVAQSPTEEGRDDEVEMEDIKDCRVSQEEEGVSLEEKRRSVHSQHKW